MAEQQQDVDTLKRRGRRRLVGAVALVLLAVIVLPMVFDPEPRPDLPPVSVRIPGENDSAFTPKPAFEAPAKAPSAGDPPPAVKPAPPPAAKPPAERKSAKASGDAPRARAPQEEADYVVPVGSFASPAGVIAQLAAARIPHYTERAPGNLTRVRAGPFATREAAEKAARELRALGLQPGAVADKSG